ncbi:isoprenoid synthase domain-containing protein [Aspergillus varians]
MTSTTALPVKCHPLAPQLTQAVHAFLEQNWPFSSEKYKTAFFAMDFPRLLALICPEGSLDRLESAALFVCLTGILDDAFSQMSISDSREIGLKLLNIMQGTVSADLSSPVEKVLAKIISDMNSQDAELAKDVLAGAIALFHAQTDKERLGITQLDEYFEFRFRDVGGEFFTAIVRFVGGVMLEDSERVRLHDLERAAVRHFIIVNDILSWEKELREANESDHEGAALCSAVPILARNLGVGYEGAKRVLWVAAREVEGEIERMVAGLGGLSDGERYAQGLRYFASGTEEWSRTTSRYRVGSE